MMLILAKSLVTTMTRKVWQCNEVHVMSSHQAEREGIWMLIYMIFKK